MRSVSELDRAAPRPAPVADSEALPAARESLRARLATIFAVDRTFPLLAIVLFFVLWEVACRVFKVPVFILPKPSEFLSVLVTKWPAILPNAIQTLYTTIVGFFLGVAVGAAIGACIGLSRFVYRVTYPLLIGFYSVPKIAVVPILVIWFGIGTIPAILTAAIMCLFPVVVNVATGLATTEPELEDVLRALGASKLDILRRVGLPRSMPYFFASLKIAVSLAFVGTVVAETVAANIGIGSMMILASSTFDVPLVFAGVFLLAVLGVAMYAIFALIERRVTFWARRNADVAV
ncbi:MAG TPA: ABC transporter permease [Casimicrobiaceae bacterium]|nr:ABC transporter permease [Casimicrobiaceae bacterium]